MKIFFIRPKLTNSLFENTLLDHVGQLNTKNIFSSDRNCTIRLHEISSHPKLANSLHENYFIEPNSSKIISSDPSWSTQYQKIFFIRPKLYNYHTQLDKNYFIRPKLANSLHENIFIRPKLTN